MQNKKRKLVYLSDFSKTKTGFGRNAKAVLSYLYSTGKYEIVEYACAPFSFKDERLKSVPWKAYGALPEDPWVLKEVSKNGALEMMTNYGSHFLNEIIETEQPDFFLGVQDFWAFTDVYDNDWWNKIHCALWVTIDSLPIYKDAVENAHKIKNFWVWSKFAENEFKRLGHNHVKTLPGAFDITCFKPLDAKAEIKRKNNIDEDCFIFGFVFRNQTRKLVGTLLEGFADFKKKNPNKKAKVLLHTSWNETWKIPEFIKEFGLDNNDILTTYVCNACGQYTIKNFEKDSETCPKCQSQHSLTTVKTYLGATEQDMNEIFNMIDLYVHPVTSGGLEMPIVESMMAGTPVATVNYSCGEEFCETGHVLKIDHVEYREAYTQFRKAQPLYTSISEIMKWSMENPDTLEEYSKAGTAWASERFAVERICKEIEHWLDTSPEITNRDFKFGRKEGNPNYEFKDIEDDTEWAIDLVRGVFNHEDTAENEGVKKIVKKLQAGESKKSIHEFSIHFAKSINDRKNYNAISTYIKDEDKDFTVFICPNEMDEKLLCIDFVTKLCELEKNLFLICDIYDEEIFSQCGSFRKIPKSEYTVMPEWLESVTNKTRDKVFKKIIYKYGSIFRQLTI